MDNFLENLKSFLSTLPVAWRIVVCILFAILFGISLFFFSSCGSTVRAVVTNKAEGVTTSVSVTTSNPTTVQVSPDTKFNFSDSLKIR